MEIQRVGHEGLTPEALKDLKELLDKGFEKDLVPKKFSWQNFVNFWELMLFLPNTGLWFLYDDEEKVVGVIGGICTPDCLTEDKLAIETCWQVAEEVKGKGLGWELLTTFIEWAVKEQEASKVVIRRFLTKDEKSNANFDVKVSSLGFLSSGYEYCLNI